MCEYTEQQEEKSHIRRLVRSKTINGAVEKATKRMIDDGFNMDIWKYKNHFCLEDGKTFIVKFEA